MIVIPMAGLSSRFFKAGYTLPKYMLMLGSETVFEWSVKSFESCFETDHFIFVVFDHFETTNFVKEKVTLLGIRSYEIVVLNEHTLGQADTVYQGIKYLNYDDELFIFNIDSRLDNFKKLETRKAIDGYLEVFHGEGEHWSFIRPGLDHNVVETTEKVRISDLCSNGLYYFKSANLFKHYVTIEIEKSSEQEIYIAPLYNAYIQAEQIIKYVEVTLEDIHFCGTPDEYKDMLDKVAGEKA